MKYSFWKHGWLLALAGVALLGVASCGDDGGGEELASEFFGTWDLISIEAAEMSQNCPGEIELSETQSVSCGTQTATFNSDGTFAEVETTDELGDPYAFRTEGTWSTQGSSLSLTYTDEGPDESNLQPIEPPQTDTGTWSVAGNTLTLIITNPYLGDVELKATLEKR